MFSSRSKLSALPVKRTSGGLVSESATNAKQRLVPTSKPWSSVLELELAQQNIYDCTDVQVNHMLGMLYSSSTDELGFSSCLKEEFGQLLDNDNTCPTKR